MVRSWTWRLLGGVALTGVLYLFFYLVEFGPHLGPLLVVVLAGVALAWLMYDAMGATPEGWAVPRRTFAAPPGQDSRTASYLRLVEDNLTARDARPMLRDRLRTLADLRLRQEHDLELSDPRAESLLGHDVHALLTGPPRRISARQIDQTLTRIEEL